VREADILGNVLRNEQKSAVT